MKITKLLLASHNKNKLAELKNMLKPYQVEVVSAVELNLSDVEETGETFEDNARLKAETLAKMSGFYCLADDSGLCVNCLGGKPGVFSARQFIELQIQTGKRSFLKDGLMEKLPGRSQEKAVSVMIRYLFPRGMTRVLPNWGLRRKTGFLTAGRLCRNL